MSGRGKKAKIHVSKPEPPPFLQRVREQIVANEDAERIEHSVKKRKERSDRLGTQDDIEDDPTIVKVNDDDLTEEEYKRMKRELETQYKLDNKASASKSIELNVDELIGSRKPVASKSTGSKSKPESDQKKVAPKKLLSYADDDSSSLSEDDDK